VGEGRKGTLRSGRGREGHPKEWEVIGGKDPCEWVCLFVYKLQNKVYLRGDKFSAGKSEGSIFLLAEPPCSLQCCGSGSARIHTIGKPDPGADPHQSEQPDRDPHQ
jgi:hypothetical protein